MNFGGIALGAAVFLIMGKAQLVDTACSRAGIRNRVPVHVKHSGCLSVRRCSILMLLGNP